MFFNTLIQPMDIDLREPKKYCRRFAMLNYGKVTEQGKWHQLLKNGSALCSESHRFIEKTKMLSPPDNLCSYCAILEKCKDKSHVRNSSREKDDLERELWIQYYEKLEAYGYCYTCHKKISFNQYKAKRLFAEDPICFNNHRPLCRHCFVACGKMDLESFKRKFFHKKLKDDFQPMDLEWTNDKIFNLPNRLDASCLSQ